VRGGGGKGEGGGGKGEGGGARVRGGAIWMFSVFNAVGQ
jgi:hypothetical protein